MKNKRKKSSLKKENCDFLFFDTIVFKKSEDVGEVRLLNVSSAGRGGVGEEGRRCNHVSKKYPSLHIRAYVNEYTYIYTCIKYMYMYVYIYIYICIQ